MAFTCIPNSYGAPANDNFAGRITITGTNTTVTGSNVGATAPLSEPDYYYGYRTVWWTWTAPVDCLCVLSTEGSSFDTVVTVYSGSDPDYLNYVDENDDADSGTRTSLLKIEAKAGTTYQISVDGYEGEEGSIRLKLTVEPSIIGRPAPAWALQTPLGVTRRSSEFQGKVVILNFWATWCPPCVAEIPDLMELQARYGADGLTVIGASLDSNPSTVNTWMRERNPPLNYPVVMADYLVESGFGGISAVPTTFVIDRNGVIRRKYVGSRSVEGFLHGAGPFLFGGLRTGRSDSSCILRWRPEGSPILEHTSSLTPANWTPWGGFPQEVNGTNVLSIPSAGSGFFRLNYD